MYEEAILAAQKLIEEYPGAPVAYDARWLLATSYEAKGDLDAALNEYKLIRSRFAQTEYGTEALEKIQFLEQRKPALSPGALLQMTFANAYRIGEEDELEISVYGDKDLAKTQIVRPDGKIAFPLVGDIHARGLTPDELREQLTRRLAKYVKKPNVTVIVSKYNSKQVFVLGQVKTQGVLRLSADITLLQAISRAGGMTEEADLQGALLVRDAQPLPINFEKLLRHGDMSQNALLRPNDIVLIPNVSDKKVFILGEVKQPRVISLKQKVTLIEAISSAGGFTRDAQSKNVLILRGGLGSSRMTVADVDEITDAGQMAHNMLLQPNDVVYVPKTLMAKAERYFEAISKAVVPIVLTEFGIALYPTVKSVLTTGSGPSVGLIPQPQPPP
jgi:protein involved in polysaccharide export with SLBB domain